MARRARWRTREGSVRGVEAGGRGEGEQGEHGAQELGGCGVSLKGDHWCICLMGRLEDWMNRGLED